MAGVPFFRGANRMDWFYAVLLQTACDWRSPQAIVAVANQWGHVKSQIFPAPVELSPPVTVIVCVDYVFVVSSSTQKPQQWIGNVLGSSQAIVAGAPGRVQQYFGGVAQYQYSSYIQYLQDNLGSRKVVFLGFSLGAAAVTIESAMLKTLKGISSSCIVFGSPRPGNPFFAAGFDATDFQRFQYFADPVAGVPPTIWASVGTHVGWVPNGELVTYNHIQPGSTLFLPDEIRGVDEYPSPTDVILDFDLNGFQDYHNQDLYARVLRKGLPKLLSDGYEDYPHASNLDDLAYQVFWSSFWGQRPYVPPIEKGSENMLQASFYIRNPVSGLGFQEVYYFLGTDVNGFYNSWSPDSPGTDFAKRTAFLSQSCEIYAFRVSLVGGPRTSRLKKFTSPLVGQVTQQMVDIEDCLAYFGYNANQSAHRQFHYRGMANTWIRQSVVTPVGISNLGLIDAWHGFLITRNVVVGKPVQVAAANITAVSKDVYPAPCRILLDASITVPANTLMNIRGCRKTPMLNGVWLSDGSGGVTSNIFNVPGSQGIAPFPGTIGTVKFQTYKLSVGEAISRFEYNGAASKKTGKQSFLRRGRRSAQLRHR